MKRVSRRGETERYETLEKQLKIRAHYFEVFKRFPNENIAIIKSEEDRNATQSKIRAAVDGLYGWNK